jgi:hypothetical protein
MHIGVPLAILLSAIMHNSSLAQDEKPLSNLSPKLREFLIEHPVVLRKFTSVLSETCSGRTVLFYYFYSEDESVPRAYHDYPDESHVAIYVRENQQPLDEMLCLIFERWNSTNEKQFTELWDKAKSGAMTRSEFTREVGRLEFGATKKTRDLLKDIKLSRGEKNKSHYYKLFLGVPDEFDEYLAYLKKLPSSRDVVKELETKYDQLRKGTDH